MTDSAAVAANHGIQPQSKTRPRRRRRFRTRDHRARAVETDKPAKPKAPEEPANEVDPFAFVGQEDDDSEGEDCALHVYESRYDTRGERVKLKVGTKTEFLEDKDKSHKAGFVLTKHYDSNRSLLSTEFEIRSPLAKRALREVVGTYPGANIHGSKRIVLRGQPTSIFHYRKELVDYAEASSDARMMEHVQFCIRYMEKTLRPEIETYNTHVVNALTEPGLNFKNLWMGFTPGDLLFAKRDEIDTVVRLKEMRLFEPPKDKIYATPYWHLETELLRCDGQKFGLTSYMLCIDYYEGCKAFQELSAYPLRYHKDEGRVRRSLIARGRKFVSMLGPQYRLYEGKALLCHAYQPSALRHFMQPLMVRQRIMLDCQGFRQNCAYGSIRFVPTTKTYEVGPGKKILIPDDDLLICDHSWPGYSMVSKRWGMFEVSKVQGVDINKTAFRDLVLPQEKKDLISALVKQQKRGDVEFDDLIKGKGKGLIVLLHGPPGVGKTFTAESIADHTRRPLLSISSDQLMSNSTMTESNLSTLLALAKRWDALVLLDEADVFMQKRGLQDLARNSLVSILLRVLEYFEGIMFLTTNRVETIDDAFKSRIHLSLSYPKLDVAARTKMWASGLARASRDQQPVWATDDVLKELADANVNGRNIKNIIRLGCSLASDAGRKLEKSDILKGLQALESFETDFKSLSIQDSSRTLQKV